VAAKRTTVWAETEPRAYRCESRILFVAFEREKKTSAKEAMPITIKMAAAVKDAAAEKHMDVSIERSCCLRGCVVLLPASDDESLLGCYRVR